MRFQLPSPPVTTLILLGSAVLWWNALVARGLLPAVPFLPTEPHSEGTGLALGVAVLSLLHLPALMLLMPTLSSFERKKSNEIQYAFAGSSAVYFLVLWFVGYGTPVK